MLLVLALVPLASGAIAPRAAGIAAGTRQQLALFRIVSSPAAPRPRYDIVIVDVGGSRPRVIVGESRRNGIQPLLFDRPSWSPDGRKLVFSVDVSRSGGRVGARTDLYVVRSDGTGLRQLTRSGRAFAPAWSPKRATIAFAERDSAARVPLTASLWTVRPGSGVRRQLLRSAEGQQDLPGSWSPDGSQLAFTHVRYDPLTNAFASAIYVVRSDGSRLRKLTDRGSEPAWSPDGRRIAFVSDRDENGQLSYGDRSFFANELYVMDADGAHRARLTWTKSLNERSPSWSTEGQVIAYQRGRVIQNAEGTVVLVVNADGSCTRPIAADPKLRTWYARPNWRPLRTTRENPLHC